LHLVATETEPDAALRSEARDLLKQMRDHIDRFEIHLAIEAWLRVVYAANKYIDEQAPWTLRKSDPDRMTAVLATLFQVIRDLAILIQPFVPEGAAKILDQMAIGADERAFAEIENANWFKQFVEEGRRIGAPSPAFPRIVEPEASRAG
jgi:methionyl-tRNA synthetase